MKLIQRLFLFLTLVCSSIMYCDAQDTWKFSTGLGLPELAHIGVSYQYSQAEFGLRFGTLPLKNEDIYQYSAEFCITLLVRQKLENKNLGLEN